MGIIKTTKSRKIPTPKIMASTVYINIYYTHTQTNLCFPKIYTIIQIEGRMYFFIYNIYICINLYMYIYTVLAIILGVGIFLLFIVFIMPIVP